jgi:hypothetical protein
VIVTVIFVCDVDHGTLGVRAPVEHLQTIRIVDAGLRRAQMATGRRRRRRRSRPAVRLGASAEEDGNRQDSQCRNAGTQLNRDSAKDPGPATMTCAFASTAR